MATVKQLRELSAYYDVSLPPSLYTATARRPVTSRGRRRRPAVTDTAPVDAYQTPQPEPAPAPAPQPTPPYEYDETGQVIERDEIGRVVRRGPGTPEADYDPTEVVPAEPEPLDVEEDPTAYGGDG